MPEVKTAVAWYTPEEYAKFQSAADDPEVWDDDYESWKAAANSAITKFEAQGMVIVKIPLTLEQIEDWCTANDKKNDSSARSQYAVSKLQQQETQGT